MPSTIAFKKHSTMLSLPAENPLVPGHWSQKPWLRTVMGILAAQGLFLFLRRCVEAYHLYQLGPQITPFEELRDCLSAPLAIFVDLTIVQPLRDAWTTPQAFFLWQGLQVAALLLGGILAGAGQRSSWQYGGVIGLINGFISLFQFFPHYRQDQVPEALLYGQPLIYVVVGITASLIGAWIWPPMQVASSEDLRKAKEIKVPWFTLLRGLFDFKSMKVHWVRCLLSGAVASLGILYMRTMFDWVKRKLALSDFLVQSGVQTDYVITMLNWMCVFFCALAAGANTRHGWIQGFWVGLASAVVFIIKTASGEQSLTAAEVPTNFATYLVLGIAGAAFGARLLPPVLKHKREVPRMTGI